MQLTQKIKIFPIPEQEEVLWKLAEKCRLIYNFALKERIDAWKNGKFISYIKQQNDLPKLKEQYPGYNWVYSKVLQYTLRILDADYKSFFSLWRKGDKSARPPRFKSKKYFTTLVYNQSGFKFEKGKISLSHKYNNIKLKFKIPEKFIFDKIYQVAVLKQRDDFYLSITYEKQEKPFVDNHKYLAIDLGISKIATCVDNNGKFLEFENKRANKYWEKIINQLKSRRDHCKRNSRRWKKLNKQIRKCISKEHNQIRDFQHKVSRSILEKSDANTIIIGDLDVRGMPKSKDIPKFMKNGLNRATQNYGSLSRFAWFLTYKSTLVGKRVIRISEKGTSKTCYNCGKEHEMKIWDREMICNCGVRIDRDRNSAIRIMKSYLTNLASVDRLSSFEDNLRQTGLLIGNHSQEVPSFI